MLVIYKAEFPNGKVYIGKSKNFEKRIYHHIWNSTREEHKHIKMSKAILKYGKDNIKWEIIYECSDIDDMNKKEIEYIKLYNSTSHNFGYNMVCGDKDGFSKRENFDKDYQIDIILRKLESNGHDSKKYVIITDELKKDILIDYIVNKSSLRYLVKKYKISRQRISRLIKSENIEIDKDKIIEVNTKTFNNVYIKTIIDMFKNGQTIKEIAKKEDKTIMIISRILHDSGVRESKRFLNGKRYDGRQPKNRQNKNDK